MKHHRGEEKATLGFRQHRIGTLVSMATDSSRRVKMGEHLVSTLAPSVFIMSSSFLQVRRATIIPQFECQKRISNVKIRYSVPIRIRISKKYSRCQSTISGPSWNVKIGLRMLKFDIQSQFECQHKISNVKISYSAQVRMSK